MHVSAGGAPDEPIEHFRVFLDLSINLSLSISNFLYIRSNHLKTSSQHRSTIITRYCCSRTSESYGSCHEFWAPIHQGITGRVCSK